MVVVIFVFRFSIDFVGDSDKLKIVTPTLLTYKLLNFFGGEKILSSFVDDFITQLAVHTWQRRVKPEEVFEVLAVFKNRWRSISGILDSLAERRINSTQAIAKIKERIQGGLRTSIS